MLSLKWILEYESERNTCTSLNNISQVLIIIGVMHWPNHVIYECMHEHKTLFSSLKNGNKGMNKSFLTPVQDENFWIFLLLLFLFYKYFHKFFMVSWKVINACFSQWRSTVSMCSQREACVIILFNYVQDTSNMHIQVLHSIFHFLTKWKVYNFHSVILQKGLNL